MDDVRSATVVVDGVRVPRMLYGTAWKEDRTEPLVDQALATGFRGIDTANQRRHYHEAGVGAALQRALASGAVSRDDLFVQTKFTYAESQDARLPFDRRAPEAVQVRQSAALSLEHLGVERLDSLLLHGPRGRVRLAASDIAVWRTMEELHREGLVRLIGASNMGAGQLAALCDTSAVRPAFVQNRCFARMGWDREVRAVCRDQGVVYQGFSLLTANLAEISDPTVAAIARRHERTIPQVVFRLALQLGMICLTGTTSTVHMRQDLDAFGFTLENDEVASLERISS
jgi:diketogulonate reductase-like aldo/keto reductase